METNAEEFMMSGFRKEWLIQPCEVQQYRRREWEEGYNRGFSTDPRDARRRIKYVNVG